MAAAITLLLYSSTQLGAQTLSGMIMMTVALLARNPDPTEADIHHELSGSLCRCGTHVEIVQAVQRASVLMRQAA